MPPYSMKQHAYLWCRINTAPKCPTSGQTSKPHNATHLPPFSALMARSTEWRCVRGNARLFQNQTELNQGTNHKKIPFNLPSGPSSQMLRVSCVAISSCFDVEAPDGIWSACWCKPLWGISHPNLSEVRASRQLWWLVDDEFRHVADWQIHRLAIKTLIQEEWQINPRIVILGQRPTTVPNSGFCALIFAMLQSLRRSC